MDNKAFFKLSYGLFVLTTSLDGRDNGCIVNTVQQVTSDPLRICVAVNKSNLTHDLIVGSGSLAVSVISEDASFDLFKRFGFASGRDTDKFAGFGDCKRVDGLYVVTKGVNSFMTAGVADTVDLGTHTMFIADVTDAAVLSDAPSATYAYYHANIKPKPEQPAQSSGKTAWRCRICGYIYEGEELPEDFICPLCKHPASDFEKISL